MLRTTLAGLRLHKGRLVTTALAIALGVMFVAGTLVFTDTVRASYSAQVMGSAERMDAVALPAGDSERPLPPGLLDEIRALPEIDRAEGMVRAEAPLLDRDGRAVGAMPTLAVSVGGLSRYTAAEGELPAADDEAALATSTAEAAGYGIGDTAEVLDADGERHAFTVTGLVDFGVDPQVGYQGAVVFTPETATRMTGVAGFAEIDAVAAEGVPAEEAAAAVDAVAGSGAEVITGRTLGERLADRAGVEADSIATALLLFAVVSVVVAAIVIHNTFAILVAQRQREMALLRCVGARRGQVFTSVVVEALVVGLAASVLGVLAGIALAAVGFRLGGDALDAGAGAAPVVLTPAAVVVGLAVGTLTTLIAAVLPARRATFVPPLAALRGSAVATGLDRRTGWLRTGAGAVLLSASALLVAYAVDTPSGQQGLVVVALAGILAFLGVVVLSPLLVRLAVAALAPLMRLLGVSGALAADNARRNPRRAATAMVALTVGATLISGYSVVNASMRATTDDMLDRQFPFDYQLTAQLAEDGPATVPAEVAEDLRDSPAIGSVIADRSVFPEAGGQTAGYRVATYRGAELGRDLESEMVAGDLADVGPGRAAVDEEIAAGRSVGDTVAVETARGEREYEIAAIVPNSSQLWGVTLAPRDFAAAFPEVTEDSTVLVTGAEDAEPGEVRAAVEAVLADHPTVQMVSMSDMRAQFDTVLAGAFLAIMAMLGLAVLIAVFGIANTLALSVLERTRESAMLRALGLRRGQLRLMLALEAVVLCLTGALVGVALGVFFGWAAGSAVLRGLIFQVPADQIAAFLAIAVAAGLLASVLPARRAARTSITAAMAGR
ncbi:putative ABC transport system permease protein [Streptomonospora nanhaiensis]|uniref:Putative ABC transport system permease protein n=1 Tax=Streptomonospora nanhaiensis TaxID=1323731 RepID=A0A853BH51_9ACTN|nr:FtsX-like permease family protein [Streptomonospora nanhaiensis]NYI93951.1 putative ABC transport system permease protein [Streptomonospora nanhaiensis]